MEERPASPAGRPSDPRDRQDIGHSGEQTPDFGQDYGHRPELDDLPPRLPPGPQPADRPMAMGASSGELWVYRA